MPPTFGYVMCLLAYFLLMAAGLAVAGVLFLVPSRRRLALRLGFAVLMSLPGMLACQFVVGIGLVVLLVATLGYYAAAHPPESVQWAIGIPTILIMVGSLASASILGCYAGARIGWLVGGGPPFKANVVEKKLVEAVSSWFRRFRR
jgi:hypothetical protein